MPVFTSHSVAETESLGESWGREAHSGWVIGLSGDLGAGKTQLVKGIARGLDVRDRVQSPTFALINEYRGGRLPLFHIDLYRLETRDQIIDAGLEEYFFQPPGLAVIEWIDRWLGDCGPGSSAANRFAGHGPFFRLATIEQISESGRRIVYEDFVA